MKFQQTLHFNKLLNLRHLLRVFIDPCTMVLALYACVVYYEGVLTPQYIVLSIFVFALSFPGNWDWPRRLGVEIKLVLSQWLMIVGVLLFFGYATDYLTMFSHQILMAWLCLTPLILLAVHVASARYLTSQYYLSRSQKTTVIVGYNELGMQLRDRIAQKPELGIAFKGFFDDVTQATRHTTRDDVKHESIGQLQALPDYVKQHAIHQILITFPAGDARLIALLDQLKDTTASIYYVPDFFMTDLIQARIDEIDGMPVVAMCETPFSGWNGAVKRLSDVLIASVILLLIFPLLLVLSIGVKLSSTGPIIFKQRRYGLDGREITVYKFRSMTVMEDGAKVVQATANDARVTPFGRFIRKTSLDELPQFINVLQGHMSIVGPRPHAVTHNEMYRTLIKGYMVRHKVKPGITGWAQIHGFRGETASVESMKNRIDYDLEYLKKWSLGLDLKIIAKTVLCVFSDASAY